MKKLLFSILFALVLLLSNNGQSDAAFINRQDLIKPAAHAVHVTSQNSVRIIMVNLHYVDRVDYVLSYTSREGNEGIIGNFDPGFPVLIKTLYLGTCSEDSCIPDERVANIKFEVKYTFKNGKSSEVVYSVK